GDGADGDARRPFTVVAAHHGEQPAAVGEGAFLDVLDPGAIDADGDLVLALARHRAGVAADALAVVDHEPEGGHGVPKKQSHGLNTDETRKKAKDNGQRSAADSSSLSFVFIRVSSVFNPWPVFSSNARRVAELQEHRFLT